MLFLRHSVVTGRAGRLTQTSELYSKPSAHGDFCSDDTLVNCCSSSCCCLSLSMSIVLGFEVSTVTTGCCWRSSAGVSCWSAWGWSTWNAAKTLSHQQRQLYRSLIKLSLFKDRQLLDWNRFKIISYFTFSIYIYTSDRQYTHAYNRRV